MEKQVICCCWGRMVRSCCHQKAADRRPFKGTGTYGMRLPAAAHGRPLEQASSEEETLARRAVELFDIIGEEGIGLWTIDQEIGKLESFAADIAPDQ